MSSVMATSPVLNLGMLCMGGYIHEVDTAKEMAGTIRACRAG